MTSPFSFCSPRCLPHGLPGERCVPDALCRSCRFLPNAHTACQTELDECIGRDDYQRGELEKIDTFSKRVLTTEPKFVQKRRRQKLKEKENQGAEGVPEAVSTSENEKEEKMSLVSTPEKEDS